MRATGSSWDIAAGQPDALGPERFRHRRVDGERTHARSPALTVRSDSRNVAILAIDPADPVQAGRRGAPYRRRGALLRTFEIAAGIDNGGTVRIHGSELLNLLAREVPRERAEDGAGMDRESTNAMLGTPSVERDGDTVMRHDPDSASAAVATLTNGTRLVVKRVLWHNLRQWVEVEMGSETGYVLSTDVELS